MIGNIEKSFRKYAIYLKPKLDKNKTVSTSFQSSRIYFLLWLMALQTLFFVPSVFGQIAINPAVEKVEPKQIIPEVKSSLGRYLDLANGTTADEAVRVALEKNGELKALRDELESAKAQIKQAELKPNPRLKIMGSQEGIIGNRYSGGASISLPLELGGRRDARIGVAEARLKVRESLLRDSERKLVAEVRVKFGESLARIEKLKFLEELLGNINQGYKLISAKVTEGSNAPLEQNMSLVELNRIRSMREVAVADTEIKLLELRNVMGIDPTEILRLKGDFASLLNGIPTRDEAIARANSTRPDLESLRLILTLGDAKLEQARSDGRLDAGVSLGFQRMTRIQPMISNRNPVELMPNRIGENFLTFGVDLLLPVRNKNQGNIESATLEINAAKKRLEFGELTVRREVIAAFTKYEAAIRALTIYRVGVRKQAKENLQVIWQTYEFGDKDLIDYISEERRYLDLENNLIDAELSAYLAKIEIYRAINSPKLIVK